MIEEEINIISARKIYDVLDAIEAKPNVWLTSKTISSLQDFLNGFMTLGFNDDIYNPGEPNFTEFNIWLYTRLQRTQEINNSFRNLLLSESKSNEESAFIRFFDYLKEFKVARNFIDR